MVPKVQVLSTGCSSSNESSLSVSVPFYLLLGISYKLLPGISNNQPHPLKPIIIMKFKITIFLLLLLSISCTSPFNLNLKCGEKQYFNTITMLCTDCPTASQIGNWTTCVCPPGYNSNPANPVALNFTCTPALTCTQPDIVNAYNDDGSPKALECLDCRDNSIPNSNYSACIPCGLNQVKNGTTCVPDPTLSTNYVKGTGGYYNLEGYSYSKTSLYINYLAKNMAGCFTFNGSQLECSALMNICLFSLFTDEVCTGLSSRGYLYSTSLTTQNENVSSQVSSSSSLDLTLMRFLPTGTYHSSKKFQMTDILFCESMNDNNLRVGNSYEQTCQFSFNNVLQMAQSLSEEQRGFTYSMFISNGNQSYLIPVETNVNGNKVTTSRFFTADLFSLPLTKSLTVMTSFELQITLNQQARLSAPKIVIGYTKLPVGASGALANPVQTVTYKISYNFNVNKFNIAAIVLFIAFTVISIVQAAIRAYIAYLNKRSLFIFFIYLGENWSSWMFVVLLGLSGYWFFFTKATTTILVLMPTSGNLYAYFIAVVVLMVIIRALSVGWIKHDSFKTDIFFIDWEVSQFKNCWREVFIANSLSEFFTFRTISFGWILVITTFFLVGFGWENEGRVSTAFGSWSLFITMSEILLFFICCSVMFLVGIIMKILRRVVFTWWPHPFDDFVDFCCLANISVYFPNRNSPTGFYIHGNNVNGSEITLMELNDAILKGNLRKTNSLFNPGLSSSEANTFLIYSNTELETKLLQLRREDEEMVYDVGRKKGYTKLFKHLQDFINNDLKRIFLNLPKERNPRLTRKAIEEYLGIPPINLHTKRDQISLAADTNSNIYSIFPNADEFGDIITYCILFGGLNVALKSSSIAAFLTYLIMEWGVQSILGKAARVHIERCTKVKQGFML